MTGAIAWEPRKSFAGGGKLHYADWDTSAFNIRDLIEQHLADAVGCAGHAPISTNTSPLNACRPIRSKWTAHTYGHDILYAVDPAFRQAGYVEAKDRGFIATYRRLMRFIQDEVFGAPLVFQRLPVAADSLSGLHVLRGHAHGPRVQSPTR